MTLSTPCQCREKVWSSPFLIILWESCCLMILRHPSCLEVFYYIKISDCKCFLHAEMHGSRNHQAAIRAEAPLPWRYKDILRICLVQKLSEVYMYSFSFFYDETS